MEIKLVSQHVHPYISTRWTPHHSALINIDQKHTWEANWQKPRRDTRGLRKAWEIKSCKINSNREGIVAGKKTWSTNPKSQKWANNLPKINGRFVFVLKDTVVSLQPCRPNHCGNSVEFNDILLVALLCEAKIRTKGLNILMLIFPANNIFKLLPENFL